MIILKNFYFNAPFLLCFELSFPFFEKEKEKCYIAGQLFANALILLVIISLKTP
jgi:hypothetical protein